MLVLLSVILTASVLIPDLGATAMLWILGGGLGIALLGWIAQQLIAPVRAVPIDRTGRDDWRMPPLDALAPATLRRGEKLWLTVLRLYLVVAGGLVLIRIGQLALTHQL